MSLFKGKTVTSVSKNGNILFISGTKVIHPGKDLSFSGLPKRPVENLDNVDVAVKNDDINRLEIEETKYKNTKVSNIENEVYPKDAPYTHAGVSELSKISLPFLLMCISSWLVLH